MSQRFRISFLAVLVTTSIALSAWAMPNHITPEEAISHVGETATVCGFVASTKYAYRSKGQPTFLNLNQPYPYQTFTALIWKESRYAFQSPERKYLNKDICVTGRITTHRGIPEIIVRTPSQILER